MLSLVPVRAWAWVTLLADLPREVEDGLSRLEGEMPAEAAGVLAVILSAALAHAFDPGPVRITTDGRWFATVPDPAAGSPLIVLR